MTMGEIFLAAFLEVLFSRLASHDFLNYARQEGVTKKLEKWRETVSEIKQLLRDAEEKQLIMSEAMHQWLIELTHLAYDVDDILDKFSTQMLAAKDESGASSSMVRIFIPKIKLFSYNSEMEGLIAHRLLKLSARQKELLKNVNSNSESTTSVAELQWSPVSIALKTPEAKGDGEIQKIIRLLSSDCEPSTTNFHSVAIVGMPGVGKTTLAAHVFLSDAIPQFNTMVWVSVSHNFNLERVMRTICRKVTSRPCDQDDFSEVQENLSRAIAGQKFLIVLDDVWSTCDYESWTIMQSHFHVGAPGSKILVTTREEKVAKLIGATEVHTKEVLSDGVCLKVFKQHLNMNKPPDFDALLAKKIVEKCKGLPLAAKTLGGILRSEEVDDWKKVLDDKLLSVSYKGGNISPVLKLSYHYLPSTLKRCFAYCSIFPNNYKFEKKQVILLWMAEGFLQQPEQSNQMEDVGDNYFEELVSRSLFQKFSNSSSFYVMHDLVGDLARWACGDTYFRLEDKVDGKCSPKTRHSSYSSGKFDGAPKFEKAFSEAKSLRTFLPLSLSHGHENYLTRTVIDMLPKLEYLRVLSFNGYQMLELPNSIGNLKHLRYLDLSYTLIQRLPESTTTLYNLQTLILEYCSQLKALPTKLKQLTKLRHLNNSNVPSLKGMPPQLSKLTDLQALSVFVVGKGKMSSLGEIGPLLLRWTLCLKRLENVINVDDATRANLLSKEGLDTLELEWSGTDGKELEVLDALKPHINLKELNIKGYGGVEFPTWIQQPSFLKMTLVVLENCKSCLSLPALGQLPSLKELSIRGLSGIESVGLEFYGKAEGLPFPVLETLEFKNMQDWKEWLPWEPSQQGNGAFPCLKMLSIFACPKLRGILPDNIHLLSKLVIEDCEQLVVSTTNYELIRELNISSCKWAVDRSGIQLESLEAMELSCISEFIFDTEEFMRGFTQLKSLKITGCEELTSLWMTRNRWLRIGTSQSHFVQELASLQRLHIIGCSNLICFPEVDLPPFLKELKIESCSCLVHFTKSHMPLTLRRIEIGDCLNLRSLVEAEPSSSSSSSCLTNEEASCLEYLSIWKCPSLIYLLDRSQLPRALEHLYISDCEQLKSITVEFQDNSCLECIDIRRCPNLQSLPERLYYLTNLQRLYIFECGSLVSFPEGGLPSPASNLTNICIWEFKLTALPEGMVQHNLRSLQSLTIAYCEGLVSILEEGFPSSLTVLKILNRKKSKPLSKWGLQLRNLTSLKELWINGVDPNLVTFPPRNIALMLPKSLIKLDIRSFPSLMRLSDLQFLTSLEYLEISDCQKLESVPEKYLPLSLARLQIYKCRKIQDRYNPKTTYRSIPCVQIGEKYTHSHS